MPRSRLVLAGWLAVLALALTLPAVSLAGGGGSAGDQQYTDPFSGGGTQHSTSTPAPSTTPSPASSTTPAPAPAPAPSAAPTTSADPTATIATSAGGAATASSSTLPYTGYDLWVGVGFGVTMVAGGLVLRRRAQAS
ncbi:MAG: hypothetical protein ACR2NR_12370 [Solirubrobacteraceae bacterium]